MKNLKNAGDVIEFTLPGPISSGDIVQVGKLIGVANNSGGTGDVIAVSLVGVYDLPKEADLSVTAGDKLYFDSGNNVATATDTGVFLGHAAADSAADETTVYVRLSLAGSEVGSGAPATAFINYAMFNNEVESGQGLGFGATKILGTTAVLYSREGANGITLEQLSNNKIAFSGVAETPEPIDFEINASFAIKDVAVVDEPPIPLTGPTILYVAKNEVLTTIKNVAYTVEGSGNTSVNGIISLSVDDFIEFYIGTAEGVTHKVFSMNATIKQL